MAEPGTRSFDRDACFVPADVVAAELDGEIVLYNPQDHRIHHLDRTGSIVWQLLDGEATLGELADDIADAFGAPVDVVEADLRALFEELHGEGLLADSEPGRVDEPYPADHLSDPPNPCESDAGGLSFGEAFTVRIADRDVSLRTSPSLTDGLREVLREHVVDVDPATVPAHFSAYVPGDPRELNRLYHGFCPLTRSVDPARVLRSLVDHAAMALPPAEGTVSAYVRAAIIDGQRAVLLPHAFDRVLQRYDARLRVDGVVLTDAPVLGIDIDRREVVLSDRLGLGGALDALAADLPTRRSEPPPPAGRYPIERWWFMWFIGQPGPLSRAQATRRAAQAMDPGRDLDADVLHHISTLFDDGVEAIVGDLERANPITMLLGPRG